ncbi:MAG: flagellar biosynthesis protein FlhF [Anaerovibrio sp.]|uniref:flagellar biosynthesis protein FlhF n=1 Tax=Anaerovibrio sp. TaxID=1872532 RepID=UPI0025E2E221|nr:flagellar biosynthesis protein FlhF [Anaerovibrio sp.]MCR5175922.1 flagellar biosynthesis protein FlhF [Anaerovibrio sp.]
MRIKTFKAPTLKEAMANVKAELGIDAVILHTSRSRKGGLLGFGSKEVVEVIAAVEEAQTPQRSTTPLGRKPVARENSQSSTSDRLSAKQPVATGELSSQPIVSKRKVAEQYQTAGTKQSVDNAQERADRYDAGIHENSFGDILSSLDHIRNINTGASDADTDSAEGFSVPTNNKEQNSIKVNRIIKPMEKKEPEGMLSSDFGSGENTENDVLAPEKEQAKKEAESLMQAEKQVEDDQETIRSLQNELDEMKEMLAKMGQGAPGEVELTLQQAMRNCDVDDRVIQDMIRKLSGSEIMENKDTDKAHRILEKYLKKTVRVASGITLYSDRPKIVALVGPTGVGKTTTLAKIAAKFVLDNSVSTALITADTYRISAVEQLKTYSDILGLPLEIVYSSDALQQAIEKHSDKKLILIDTAGRSQYNDYQMKEICDLLSVDAEIEKHLVISSTTKNRDAEEILARFSACQPDRIIFTKTDETSSLGLLLNILYKRKVALSYVTDGQSVPDDITPASYTKLAEMLLR